MKLFKIISTEKILLICITIAELYRFTLPFFYNPIDNLWSDPGRWWEYASTGLNTPPLALIDAPLFQAWISFIAKFTLDIPELTALYAGLMSAIMPWFWYKFLRELFPCNKKPSNKKSNNKNIALLGWLIIACLPSWTGIYSYFMSETLLLPLLGISLWLSFRSLRKKDSKSFLLASLFWLLCSLTRGVTAPIMLIVLFLVWLKQANKVESAFLSILLASIILGSLSYRSYVRSGLIAPLGQSMLNSSYAQSGKKEININYFSDTNYGFVYGFVSPSINTKPLTPFSDWSSARQGKFQAKIDLDNQAYSWELAKQQASSISELSYGQLVKENVIFLFFGASWPDNNQQHIIENLSIIMRFIWLPLTLVAIALIILSLRKNTENDRYKSVILLSAFIGWFVFQGLVLVSVNEGRYRKPIEGIIITMVLFGLHQKKKLASSNKEINKG